MSLNKFTHQIYDLLNAVKMYNIWYNMIRPTSRVWYEGRLWLCLVLVSGRASEPCGGLCVCCVSGAQAEEGEGVRGHGHFRCQPHHFHKGGVLPRHHSHGAGRARGGHETAAGCQERCVRLNTVPSIDPKILRKLWYGVYIFKKRI